VVLAKGSVLKAIAMIVFGLLLSDGRFRHRDRRLADGVQHSRTRRGLGLPRWRWRVGFAEIIRNLDAGAEMDRDLVQQKITGLMRPKKI